LISLYFTLESPAPFHQIHRIMNETPHGIECIKAALVDMPAKPGVYRMLTRTDDVLYVGKAKNLRNRVSNYASASGLTTRILRMIDQTAKMEYTVTANEAEALLLEATLIKKLKPRYNILLRDDKSFPYIVIQKDHPFPQIRKHRGSQKESGNYYGPFPSASAVNQTLAILQKAFLLRPCPETVFKNRSRPCLQYQIKRCSAPCVNLISETEYAELVRQATLFLSGKSRDVQDAFAAQMEAYSAAMEYEKAARMRDRIRALTRIQHEQQLNVAGLDDADVIALYRGESFSCVQVFFFRAGNAFGNQAYFPRHADDASDEEVLSAFLGQFYQAHVPPKEILLGHDVDNLDVIEAALQLVAEHKVKIYRPQRGDKLALIDQARINAEAAYQKRLTERLSDQQQLDALADLFDMESTPTRIEVYDNSHISGQYAIGAMIVAGPEGLQKNAYRTFNIKSDTLTPGDDYAMMREVFTRRFSRLQKEDPDGERGLWPDLVLIDGGQGQLSAATEIFSDLGINDLTYVAIAKGPDRNAGRENFFLPERQPFMLPPEHPALHFLQRLRDEAHRFAIGSHRTRRAKSISQSEIDDIPGIGANRKRALLRHFGSRKEIEAASLSELENVPGISKKLAQTIYDYFQS